MEYIKGEAEQRMIAALRGTRSAGHQPMESLTRKKAKTNKKKGKKKPG